jgi:hypothetical protein
LFTGKLNQLWGATSDAEAFDNLNLDKQQALFLLAKRLNAKDLWDAVKAIENVYGTGGVGMDFVAWPYLESTLARRRDFTRLFAKRRSVDGGFYEKGRAEAILHFLYQGSPRLWHVHFDLYSPVYSVQSAMNHIRYEYFGKATPDWQMIERSTIL